MWAFITMAVLAVAAAPTASDAEPRATCRAACQRLTDCKLGNFSKQCLDECKRSALESTENGRAQLLMLMKTSCQQLQGAANGTSTREAEAELDRLEKELGDMDGQLTNDEAELERRSRASQQGQGQGRGPARGAAPPPRGTQNRGRGRAPANGRGGSGSYARPY